MGSRLCDFGRRDIGIVVIYSIVITLAGLLPRGLLRVVCV